MSIRSWLLARLGGEGADDQTLLVELTTVAPYRAPILQQMLAQRGIDSHISKRLAPVTWDERSCLSVQKADLAAATEALRQFEA